MAITLKIKNSGTISEIPTFNTDINIGELAVNYTDEKLYSANSTAVFELTGSGGSVTMSVQEAAPGGPSEGDLWWASGTNDGVLRVYYDDGVDAMWVDASPQLPGAQGIQGIQGIQPFHR